MEGTPDMTAVAAMTRDRVIGKDGGIPWHYPEDFRWFKRKTMGGTLLMGRRTFESIGRPLPGRRNVVMTRDPGFRAEGVRVVRSPDAIAGAGIEGTLYLIGGGELYRQLLPRCTDLFITHIRADFEGDTFFPAFEQDFHVMETVMETPDFAVRHWTRGG